MITFVALVFLGFVILAGGAIFGHDHDHDAHFDHDHDHDHGDGHSGDPAVSIFSLKVIGSFIMSFGVGGAIASWNEWGWISSSLVGLASGGALAALMYGILRLLYKQQSDSLVSTTEAIGKTGVVTVEIGENTVGTVDVMVAGQYRNYLARTSRGEILKGREVRVVRTNGSELVVEPL